MKLKNEIVMILRKMKLFKTLSGDELIIVAEYGKRLQFQNGKSVIKEGDSEPGLYILISGVMDVSLLNNGKVHHRFSNIHLAKMERGDYVGEYSLIDHQPASATVTAKEECLVFYISSIKFNKMIESNNSIGRKILHNMLKVLVKRARKYDNELDVMY